MPRKSRSLLATAALAVFAAAQPLPAAPRAPQQSPAKGNQTRPANDEHWRNDCAHYKRQVERYGPHVAELRRKIVALEGRVEEARRGKMKRLEALSSLPPETVEKMLEFSRERLKELPAAAAGPHADRFEAQRQFWLQQFILWKLVREGGSVSPNDAPVILGADEEFAGKASADFPLVTKLDDELDAAQKELKRHEEALALDSFELDDNRAKFENRGCHTILETPREPPRAARKEWEEEPESIEEAPEKKQPEQGQGGGEQVGDEMRYGPFSATTQGWQPTGVRLRKGQAFRLEASGKITGQQPGEVLGPYDGIGHWKWRLLHGKLGSRGVWFTGDGQQTAWEDGELLLGVPRAYDFNPNSPDDATTYWSGAFTVYIYVKKQ